MRLYHYTTIEAMIGLLVDEQVWMTDCRFCNDKKEIVSFLKQALEQWKDDARWDALSDKFSFPTANERHLADFVAYMTPLRTVPIFCLSRHSDTLSQWRSYANSGQGVCLGFDVPDVFVPSNFAGTCDEVGCKIIECVYQDLDTIDYSAALDEIIVQPDPHHVIEKIVELALRNKNVHFREEGEVRIALYGQQYLDYRSANNRLIPFFKSDDLYGQLVLKEIIIGPKLDFDEMSRAISSLLIEKSCKAAEVRNSARSDGRVIGNAELARLDRMQAEMDIRPTFFDCGLR